MEANVARDQLLLVLIVAFCLLVLLREKSEIARTRFSLVLGCLAFLGFTAHFNFFGWHPGKVHLHNLEMYHYYMGTKYFHEVGYTGLYDASIIADSEDDPYFRPDLSIRSLTTYDVIPRKQVLDRKPEIMAPFTAARWMEFRRDLTVFRGTAEPAHWGTLFSYLDHGYNGTPLITEVLSDLSAQPFLSLEDFMAFASWWDISLVLLSALALAYLLNAEAALMFLFFTAINPFNDYAMIGGAYLRYVSFVSLALGVAFYRRGRLAPSGILFAIACLFRIFPVLWVAAVAVSQILKKERAQIWKDAKPFYLSFVATCVVLMLLSSRQTDPANRNPWLGFKSQILFHGESLTMNQVGLRRLFDFSDAKNFTWISARAARGESVDWVRETEHTLEQRRLFYTAARVLILGTLLIYLRFARGSEAFLGGLILTFCLLSLSHYYYLFFSLIPLIFREERRVSALTAVAFGAMILAGAFTPFAAPVDRRFFFMSVLTLAALGSLVLLKLVRKNPHPEGPSDAAPIVWQG